MTKFEVMDGDQKVRGTYDTVKMADSAITHLNRIESIHPRDWFQIIPVIDPNSLKEAPSEPLLAKLDGFRVYKIRDRHSEHPYLERKYIAPVYVMGLPGDIDIFNKELEILQAQEHGT